MKATQENFGRLTLSDCAKEQCEINWTGWSKLIRRYGNAFDRGYVLYQIQILGEAGVISKPLKPFRYHKNIPIEFLHNLAARASFPTIFFGAGAT